MSNLLNGKSVPGRDTVVTFLTACGLCTDAQLPWLAAWERVSTRHLRTPAGAVRVRQARPRVLGVHAAIRIAGAAGELPPYVPRDLDADLRTAVTAAAASGGFVLLVGGSSVGKTRTLWEAVRAVVAEWWLLHPADNAALEVFAAEPTPRTVVWLDELQRYLNHPGGLPVGVLRSLVTADVVVVATLWPDEYGARTAPRAPAQPDPHANDRELLGLAHVIDVPETFSAAERRRAGPLASDPRVRIALDTPDAGVTQVLAAGPELVRWWENAGDPYGKAVITAALDARRVGATAPLSREFLESAAPGYLTFAQQATAHADWIGGALSYATIALRGATSALIPVAAGMGDVGGYSVADYLHQHARRARRTVPLPGPSWQALLDHHLDDTMRLADNARRRAQHRHATAFYRRAADAGDKQAEFRALEMLAADGRLDEALSLLRTRVNAGDRQAAVSLARLLAEHGRVDELRARADAGDEPAAGWLADLLVEHGRVDELRARADTGDEPARSRLAELLAEQGSVDELRTRADRTDRKDVSAVSKLAELLANQGRTEELLARADAKDPFAALWLQKLRAEQGPLDKVVRALGTRAELGDYEAATRLVNLLAKHRRVDELRARADAGDNFAATRLVELLASQGRVDELHVRADAGHEYAAIWLANLLAEGGRIDEAVATLRSWVDSGHTAAGYRLTKLLAAHGRRDELEAEMHAGTDGAAAYFLTLVGQGSACYKSG